MTALLVDSATLQDAQARLGRLGHELTTLHIAIWQVWGRLGGRALEGELEHFCGTWHGATSRLAVEISALGTSLGEAADAYRRIEQRLAGEGRRHSPGTGSGWTVLGPGPGGSGSATGSGSGSGRESGRGSGSGSGSGSGTTVIG